MEMLGPLILGAMVVLSSTATVWAQSITPIIEPPWQFQTFDFQLLPGYTDGNITQCQSLQFEWWTASNAVVQPVAPYTINFWRAGYQPYVVTAAPSVSEGASGRQEYAWTVNLPTGGPYMTSMFDSTGNLGGSVGPFIVLAAQGQQCSVQTLTPQSLNFTISGSQSSCGTVTVSVAGGVPPYRLGIQPDDLRMKFAYYSTGSFGYVLDVPAGMNVLFLVEDSQGQYAVATPFMVGRSTNTACLTVASTLVPGSPLLTSIYPGLDAFSTNTVATSGIASSTVATSTTVSNSASVTGHSHGKSGHSLVGLIVGIAIGVVLAVVLAGFLLWWKCIHRASDKSPTHDIDMTNRPYYLVEPFLPTPSMAEVSAFRQAPSIFTRNGERGSLAAQREDVKPVTSSTPFRSPYTLGTSSHFPTSPPDPRLSGYNVVVTSGDESFRRSTANPPLPPGAALPIPPISAHFGSEGVSSSPPFPQPGEAEPDVVSRFKTPPPRYSER